MCGLNVEVIEDSIDARGGSFFRGALTTSTAPPPARALAFCASDFGGGMTEALGGSLLSNVKHEITNTKWFCSPSLFSTVGVLVWLVSQLKHEILNLRILRAG